MMLLTGRWKPNWWEYCSLSRQKAYIISHIASDICETLYLLSHIFTVYESGRDRAGWGSEQEASCWKPEGEDLPLGFDSISFCFRSKKRSRSWEGDQMPWRKCLRRRKTRLKSVSLHCLLSKTRSNKDLGNEMDALNLNWTDLKIRLWDRSTFPTNFCLLFLNFLVVFAKDHVQSGESEYNKGIQNQFWNNGYFFLKRFVGLFSNQILKLLRWCKMAEKFLELKLWGGFESFPTRWDGCSSRNSTPAPQIGNLEIN